MRGTPVDKYLQTGQLRDAKHFYFNVNFELLNGCRLNCQGCHVEKNAQTPMSPDEATRLNSLLASFQQNAYELFIAFIGPTDFLSAGNTQLLLRDVHLRKVLTRFRRVSLQSTFLETRNVSAVADALNELPAHLEFEVNVILDPAKARDEALIRTIERNKETFLGLLRHRKVFTYGFMNIVEYDAEINYDSFHERLSHLFETSIDYNFSFGRNPEMPTGEFVALTERMKRHFETSHHAGEEDVGRLADSLMEKQVTYRNGKLYFSPLLYERFVSFAPQFELALTRDSVEEFEEQENQLALRQYGAASAMDECETCPLLRSCVERGILSLMSSYGVSHCIVAKKAMFAVGTMGTLPIKRPAD